MYIAIAESKTGSHSSYKVFIKTSVLGRSAAQATCTPLDGLGLADLAALGTHRPGFALASGTGRATLLGLQAQGDRVFILADALALQLHTTATGLPYLALPDSTTLQCSTIYKSHHTL